MTTNCLYQKNYKSDHNKKLAIVLLTVLSVCHNMISHKKITPKILKEKEASIL